MRYHSLFVSLLLITLSCGMKKEVSAQQDVAQIVLAQERAALDRWAAGDPTGFAEIFSEDGTYFDDIGAQTRVDGIEELRAYFASLEGKIQPHTYTIEDSKVQAYDDFAISTLHYQPSIDGQPGPRWKATDVFRLIEGEWRLVHAHWSLVKAQ